MRLRVIAHALCLAVLLSVTFIGAAAAAQSSGISKDDQKNEKQDDFIRTYDAPMDKVFLAAAQVAALKWHVTHTDKDTGIISFKTGMNMRTLRGFDMTALCMPMDD